ncbi:hypothetical protein, variant 1 [Aphanomyces invadans]|uniref:UBX domain-containing protein n=1 Tax=Aphanomyces invadans TaxID=157072 RepID=A0A024UMP0_9STRA|nr:hypothetical protein, variant 1 [Aphanomyces invadans]ETW07405.1 hypothetical protein, variant 1 [Aphanomyces invadans]|eukprot:XP_008863498.1 hypothetical protein, variant 1 [Aphanomyces invadans]
MDFDLGTRGKKLQKEQAARREAARLKIEREKALADKANQLRREMDAESQRRRDEQAQQAAAEEERRLNEQRVTGGITYKKTLRAVPIANDGDKVTLPVSALEELNPQNALDLGVFTFELVANGRTSHASVLEFVADEHTIGIPPKVARSLHLDDAVVDISVRFVRLTKGRAVRLQPLGDGFGDRQLDIKHLLERTLHTHTTLTEGDILLVRHGKMTFDVAVKNIDPEPQVTILNVDLEVDLLPSEAVERRLAAKQLAEQQKLAAEQALQRSIQEAAQRQTDALARLPDEAPANEGIKLMLRTPDGSQHVRRFHLSDSVTSVYDFITSATGMDPLTFRATTNYPRRVIEHSTMQLKDVGFVGRQEAVFVERMTTPPPEPVAEVTDVDMGPGGKENVPTLETPWGAALAQWETKQDEALFTSDAVPVHAIEPVLPTDVNGSKWGAQLTELEAMVPRLHLPSTPLV